MGGDMSCLLPGFYRHWRDSIRGSLPCQETPDPPPERWLQQVWRHQRVRRDRLVTLEGQPIRILHPGYWNREAGPDFRQAVVQFGDDPPVSGDIELDLAISGWQGHHHAGNPAYARVILHVVWDAEPKVVLPPVLRLKPYLDAPLAELVPWLEHEASQLLPPGMLGRCCGPLQAVPDETVAALLNQAAAERLHRKASEFGVRARHAGWEQTLWEGLFTALGYKHNGWPLRRVAELVVEQTGNDPLIWEARLLGLAGLLPTHPPAPPSSARQVKQLWDCWWRERERWADQILPPAVWRLGGIRPANHPHRRLALAARWRAAGTLPEQLSSWLTTDSRPDRNPAVALLELLQPEIEATEFWAHHWTLRSAPGSELRPFLGLARTTDLAVNVVLPWLSARAHAGGDPTLIQRVEERYFRWPAGQDNALLRHARTRLFAGRNRQLPRTAAVQQGLLQIVRDFCEPAGPLCSNCRFPSLVLTASETG